MPATNRYCARCIPRACAEVEFGVREFAASVMGRGLLATTPPRRVLLVYGLPGNIQARGDLLPHETLIAGAADEHRFTTLQRRSLGHKLAELLEHTAWLSARTDRRPRHHGVNHS